MRATDAGIAEPEDGTRNALKLSQAYSTVPRTDSVMSRIAFSLTLGLGLAGGMFLQSSRSPLEAATPERSTMTTAPRAVAVAFREDGHAKPFIEAPHVDEFDTSRTGRMFEEDKSSTPGRSTLSRSTLSQSTSPRTTLPRTPRATSIGKVERTADARSERTSLPTPRYTSTFAADDDGGVWRRGGKFDDEVPARPRE